ncbi:MAG: bifunctional diaminohydroxyphosphoribosylaminopyrimidine deaminase/5-amino-6-(5-phosphoribosylamino)uracil reductase RibD [Gammaproteobacteria bacterium]|nr:bifunctional diaminohydroxyphosphoribosylaminopyrimidine deaminase/5-amino-6-(5-phosphoribosylamino)uracil reductase RibD [Gammaproteobacteria bacterium]
MPDFSAADSAFMARALHLARRGQYTAHPNPMVGCVIVSDSEIVGEGWHEVAGDAHAEINALRAAGAKAQGATLYVTLEPCAHHGKTPPCASALIDAGIAAVVFALDDPFAGGDGRGEQALSDAGVTIRKGLMRESVQDLLAGFISRTTRGRPRVRLKIASSLDGRIAMKSGESQWITGPAARADVQRLRARSGAIMTGVGTVLADDPSLTVRDESIDTRGLQPLRVVVDGALRMPLSAEMLALPGDTLIYCADDGKRQPLVDAGGEVIKVSGQDGTVNLLQVLEDLAAREVNDLLVEAGPRLAGSLIAQKLVDELVIYQAPHIMGSETLGMFHTPTWTELADRQALTITDLRRVGNDTRITAQLADED